MIAVSLAVFAPPILSGVLIAHFLWPGKNDLIGISLKLFLGIGLGLGISSLFYFIYLIFFAGAPYFLYIEFVLFFILLAVAYFTQKKAVYARAPRLQINFLQIAILMIAGFVTVTSFISLVNYSRQRANGDWDAWMIFNRAARFIYRGPETWQDAFSKDIDLIFHADYPPLLALNIASRWGILNKETNYVPMFLGFLFSLAALGLCFSALASLKSLGQAGLGLILLAGVSFFLSEGGRETADLPLAYYILASVVLLFFYYHENRPILMVFAGFTAGLAAWTKNEGSLFVFASLGVIAVDGLWKRSFQRIYTYLIGLLLPMGLLVYFKFYLAPPSEFFSAGKSKIIQDLMDLSRYQLIFDYFKNFFLHVGGWENVGIFLILCFYFLLFHSPIKNNSSAVVISIAVLACQIIGYYVLYLISPYDLVWHLSYSLNRLFVQVYPATVFTILIASYTPETIFISDPE